LSSVVPTDEHPADKTNEFGGPHAIVVNYSTPDPNILGTPTGYITGTRPSVAAVGVASVAGQDPNIGLSKPSLCGDGSSRRWSLFASSQLFMAFTIGT
jgi:hypothetical protein